MRLASRLAWFLLLLGWLAGCGRPFPEPEAEKPLERREFVDQARRLHREIQTLRRAAGQVPTAQFPPVPRDFSALRAEEARAVLDALQEELFLLAAEGLRQVPEDWTEADLTLPLTAGQVTAFPSPREGRPLALRLTNTAETILPAPALVFSGLPDWSSLENILAVALAENPETDRDRALALFAFVVRARVHGAPAHPGDELHDPVRWLNSYGYGFCDDAATTLVRLARASGLEARALDLGGHVVAEIFFEGKWNVLDPDGEVFYPLDDGSLASVEEITPEVLAQHRSPTHALDYLLTVYGQPDRHKLLDERRLEIPILPLDRTLRPGESFLLSTRATGWFFSSNFFAEPPEYGSGEWSFVPVLADGLFTLGAEEAAGWKVETNTGLAGLRADEASKQSVLIYRLRSPYPMLRSRFAVKAELDTEARLLLDWKLPGGAWSAASEFASGPVDLEGEMNELFRHGTGEPTREIIVRVRLLNGGKSKIAHLRWTVGLQVAPRSLPYLRKGENTVLLQTAPPSSSPPSARLELFWED